MKTVYVFGGTSTLGKEVLNTLSKQGLDVINIGRRPVVGLKNFYFDINNPLEIPALKQNSLLILLGWIQEPRDLVTSIKNIDAHKNLIRAAHESNSKIIFVSTLTTLLKDIRSEFVAAKWAVEAEMGQADLILRPATIVSARGTIIGKNSETAVSVAKRFTLPIAPKIEFPIIELEAVSFAIGQLVQTFDSGELNLVSGLKPILNAPLLFEIPIRIWEWIFKSINCLRMFGPLKNSSFLDRALILSSIQINIQDLRKMIAND